MVTSSFAKNNFMQPMGRLSVHSKCLIFFLLSFGVGGEDFFSFFWGFPACSLQVPTGSQCVPNSTSFNPICFAQSPPLLTYIAGPKGKALHLSLESFIWWSLHSFNIFFVMGQSNGLIAKKNKKKKSWT